MKRIFSLLAALALFDAPASLKGAETLGQLVAAKGFEWMIGNWADKASDGQAIKLTYEWRLDKHAVAVKLESPERKSEGFMARNPKSGDVGYVAVDNRGGGALGKVTADEDKLVLKVNYQRSNGESGRLGVVHEKKDDDTMKVTLHKVEEDGALGEATEAIELKRVK
ncbi:MAG: hypothetical protein ACR2OZ_17535 [Verrucomicrobiales bacterium]